MKTTLNDLLNAKGVSEPLREAVKALSDRLEAAEKERDELRAKIERMEGQKPVKQEFQGRDGTWHSFIDQRHYENTVADGTWPIRSLYALPGAQPAPNIPPRIEPNGMYDGNHHYASGWNDCREEMLAAAPKPEKTK